MCYFDTLKIPRYLEYQYRNFKGNYYAENQESFINLVEFHIYPWIKEKHPENPAPILKKINYWLNINKPLLLDNPAPLLTFVKIENIDHKRKALDIFSNYFSNTDLIKLENLLNGKPAIGKLVFNGEVSKLFDAFKRLIEHKIISGNKNRISLFHKF